MGKSTKLLLGGLFFTAALVTGAYLFHLLGLDFGAQQICGTALAGLMGALRLFSGT